MQSPSLQFKMPRLVGGEFHSEILQKKDVGWNKQKEFLNTIEQACKRLARMINDVLDLSKIESGKMEYQFENFDVDLLINEVLKEFIPVMDTRGIHLRYNREIAGIHVTADRDKIIQVFYNLISNAVKFAPEKSSIEISIDHNNDNVKIGIKDSGKGISKKDIPKIFDKFKQLGKIEYHSGGSGLGMTIAKMIIERHNCKIWVESKLGKGTVVFFTLPLSKENVNGRTVE